MSFTSFTDQVNALNLRRKRIATDRATNNGDPLVVRKKAREATAASVPSKKNKNVSLIFFYSLLLVTVLIGNY